MTIRLLFVNIDSHIAKSIRNGFPLIEIDFILAREFSLALYLAQKNLPDLILCDDRELNDTVALAKEIRRDSELASTPIILLISNDFSSTREIQASSLNMQLVSKDISSDELCQRIAPYLVAKQHDRQSETTE